MKRSIRHQVAQLFHSGARQAALGLGVAVCFAAGCSSGGGDVTTTGTSSGGKVATGGTSGGATSSGTGASLATTTGAGSTTGALPTFTGTVTTLLSGDPFNSCELGDGGYFNPLSLLLRPEGLYVAGGDVDLVALNGSGVSLVMTHSLFNADGVAGGQTGSVYAFTVGTQGGSEIVALTESGDNFYLGSQDQESCLNATPADGGATFAGMTAFAGDSNDNLYIVESGLVAPGCSMVRKIDRARVATTLAGDGTNAYQDGAAAAAQFDGASGIAADAAGTVYVADSVNNAVRKIAAGTVSTLAGKATPGFNDGSGGPNGSASFNKPTAVAVDAHGNVYVADSLNYAIRMITSDGTTITLAGNGQPGSTNGTLGRNGGTQFGTLEGLAVDGPGKNLYVGDGCRLRLIQIDR